MAVSLEEGLEVLDAAEAAGCTSGTLEDFCIIDDAEDIEDGGFGFGGPATVPGAGFFTCGQAAWTGSS